MTDPSAHLSAHLSRQATLAALDAESFDLAIIGGGITGAGVAREAALAGLRVALLERDDFASGTSSRSSRLVHGGVRYLEHGHLALVFESSRERRLLLTLAPHLVRPLAFTWPVYRGARVPLWKVRAGLTLYDALALFRNARGHEALSTDDVLRHEPALRRDQLRGGARYWDAATDDARLTLASALAAREAGAVVVNHVAVVGGLRAGPGARLHGVLVEDRLAGASSAGASRAGASRAGASFAVRARVVINATGPWSDATGTLTGAITDAASGTTVRGSAGTHIAVLRQRLGNRDAVTVVSPTDGRVMFVLPAGTHAIIGTTEHPAQQGPDEIRATECDVAYLLKSANAMFPAAQLTTDDVVAAWAGIRPLAAARAGERSANTASREHAITQRADGLISVTGGKLTTYRAMADDVVTHARRALTAAGGPVPSRVVRTAHEARHASITAVLPGGDIVSREALVHDVRATVQDAAAAERLALAYGSRWRHVWDYARREPRLSTRLQDELPYLLAEVPYAIEREMACTFSDLLIRRTHIAFETRDHGRAAAARIATMVAACLQWSSTELSQQLATYEADIVRLFGIDAGTTPSTR